MFMNYKVVGLKCNLLLPVAKHTVRQNYPKIVANKNIFLFGRCREYLFQYFHFACYMVHQPVARHHIAAAEANERGGCLCLAFGIGVGDAETIAFGCFAAETAFFVHGKKDFHIRWFTPAAEVNLCGHATLASAYVLFHHLNYSETRFSAYSGIENPRYHCNSQIRKI